MTALIAGDTVAQHAFGRRIRHLRKGAGLSGRQLANLAHISRSYLSALERGTRGRRLDPALAGALAKALGVTPAELTDQSRRG